MAESFYTILTDIGLATIANATVTQSKVDFANVAVGDSNGAYYTPNAKMTSLINEVWRGPINSITVDDENPNWIIVDAVIPSNVGGFTVREIGVFDNGGNLLAIGKVPETYKPVVTEGSLKDLNLRMILEVSNASVINLKVDPAVTIASRKYVDEKVGVVSTNLTQLDTKVNEHLAENATGAHSPKNVGLGNVQNYGVATQSEAEAGTSSNKYMTPQRTRQAIEKIAKEEVNRQTTSRDETTDPNLFSNLRSGEVLLCKHPNAPNSTNWWQISTYFGVADNNHIQVAINWSNPSDVIYIRRSSGNNTWRDWRSILEGFTMKGILKAHPNTSYTVPQVRNISFGTSEPSGGSNGDIYFQYE